MPTNNINPKIWGPHAWSFLSSIVESYGSKPTLEEKQHIKSFFELLKFTLPCTDCRDNFAQELQKFPLTSDVLANNASLRQWFENIKREVNKKNNNQNTKIHPTSAIPFAQRFATMQNQIAVPRRVAVPNYNAALRTPVPLRAPVVTVPIYGARGIGCTRCGGRRF